ncbi:MAG: GNAT family N-acetyltransferase [Bacteroidales bacterium]|nr:GNAT family N-acetyltransferase [Bacteroidales bacterium]
MKEMELNIIRISTEKEKTACAEIMAGSEPWITLGIYMDHIMKILNDPLHEVFAAYIKDEIVGSMVIHTKGAFPAYLKSIAVKQGPGGQELVEQMMDFIENEIFSTYKNLFLCVSSFNTEARQFYIKLGYERIGELKDYLVEGHDEILMRKTIAPILQGAPRK